ncbi:hypothetical protein ACFFRS_12860, partial [Saccharopolyspora hordei]|uniref:hypothetical protein n=1 Tax=Saccharopolyspora hordei TaxID=1838 RepID=UPI0035E54EDA
MTDTRQIEPSQFDGVDLATMRAWVENGSAQGLYDSADAWKAQETYLRELRSRLDDKLKEVGVVMQSESGEALQNQAVPIALWTEVAADNSLVQSELLRDQGEAFKKVQTSIPGKGEEQEIPDNNWFEDTWDSLVNGQTDAEAAKEHNEKLRQEAVQAFQTYDSTSQSTVASSAVFTPPPENGVKVAVSGSQHPSVGAVPTVSGSPSGTTSQWAGGSSAGSTTVPAGHTGGAGGVGTGGGAGGTGGGGGFAGTNPVWQRPGQNTPGRPGTGRVPGGPGTGGPGVPGVPGGGIPGTGGGAAGAGPGPAGTEATRTSTTASTQRPGTATAGAT